MKCIVAIALVLSVAYTVNGQTKHCPGGYSEGTEVNMGRYWYACNDGQLVPRGCLDESGQRIPISGTYKTSNQNYKLQCVVDASGNLAFTYKSCVYNGVERAPLEEWEDGKYYYRCERDGDYLRVNPAGCMDQGNRVGLNERVTKGDFIYQCRRSVNGTCSMCPVGCTKNGREYNIGETFELDNLLFSCTNSDSHGPIAIKVVGCIDPVQKTHLKDGDRFFKDDVIYECTVRDAMAEVRTVGCVQRNDQGVAIERRLGCYWVEGPAPLQYEMTCKYIEASKTAIKVPFRCTYKVSQGTYTIQPGCYQIVDKTAVGCVKQGEDRMNLRIYQIDQIGDLTSQGLRFC